MFFARFNVDNNTRVMDRLPSDYQGLILSTLSRLKGHYAISTQQRQLDQEVSQGMFSRQADISRQRCLLTSSTSPWNMLLSQCVSKLQPLYLFLRKRMFSCLNDYLPIALPAMRAKCFETLWEAQIKLSIPATLDQHQFACQADRLTEGTTALILNTSVPQRCALNPMLYALLTHDCQPVHASNTIVKFADDTAAVGLISNNDKTTYRRKVQNLTVWSSTTNLILNK